MTEREIALKIQEREKYPYELAIKKAKRVLQVSASLSPYVEYWYNGKECKFEYHGIDLEYIQKKINCSQIDSILIMNRMLEDKLFLEKFKNMVITYR